MDLKEWAWVSFCMSDYVPDIHYKSLSDLETSYWWHVTRLNITEKVIRNHFSSPSDLNVIDYGCGTGGFLFELNNRLGFKSFLGVDASEQAILYARRYGDYYAHVEPGDFSVFQNMDLVLLMDVLEHIDEDAVLLAKIMGSLKKDACIVISVPAHPFLFSSWDMSLNHYRRYTKKGVLKLVRHSGGNILYMNYYLSYLVLPIYFIRVFRKKYYDSNNCEFPPVNPALNKFFLLLNRFEMFLDSFVPLPMGSSLMAVIAKK